MPDPYRAPPPRARPRSLAFFPGRSGSLIAALAVLAAMSLVPLITGSRRSIRIDCTRKPDRSVTCVVDSTTVDIGYSSESNRMDLGDATAAALETDARRGASRIRLQRPGGPAWLTDWFPGDFEAQQATAAALTAFLAPGAREPTLRASFRHLGGPALNPVPLLIALVLYALLLQRVVVTVHPGEGTARIRARTWPFPGKERVIALEAARGVEVETKLDRKGRRLERLAISLESGERVPLTEAYHHGSQAGTAAKLHALLFEDRGA
ncbi:MAG: hypothetical protein IT372_12955 [Polyangiaceae bacterium]|nr:hypothetical protein [Polyangiaceae bacterium]